MLDIKTTKSSTLAYALRAATAPPSIQDLTTAASIIFAYNQFTQTVNTLLPGQVEEIFSTKDTYEQADRFAKAFEKAYLPLSDFIKSSDLNEEHPIVSMFQMFPYQIIGYSSDDIHSIWEDRRHGIAAMLLLTDITLAFADNHYAQYDNGIRTEWIEHASMYIDPAVLKQIPPDGIPQQVLTQAVLNTPYEGLQDAFPWVFAATDNPFLWYSYDDEFYQQSADEYFSPENVAYFAAEWSKAMTVVTSVHNLADWLETDLSTNFDTLLKHILTSQAFQRQSKTNEPV